MSKVIEKIERKSFKIHPSGRSSDFITPSFGFGCLFNCTYCYMKRHVPEGLKIANNTQEILEAIANHARELGPKMIKNQTDPSYWTYDISCNEDFMLHYKHHDWQRIFNFFMYGPAGIKATLATKWIMPEDMLNHGREINRKYIRVRYSLMPQSYSTILEPNTPSIMDRIRAINRTIAAGYEVHINFSPVIVKIGWITEYVELFRMLNSYVKDEYKPYIKAEVIFLTHNEDKHKYNLEHNLPGEDLLYRPSIQEKKVSRLSKTTNLRYRHQVKDKYIKMWREAHDNYIPWNKIRYIF